MALGNSISSFVEFLINLFNAVVVMEPSWMQSELLAETAIPPVNV